MKNKTFLTAGILTALTILFVLLVKTVDVAPIGPEGTSVGLSQLNSAVFEQFGTNLTWYKITTILGVFSLGIAGLFALFGLVQLIQRKSLAKVDKEIIALGGLYAATLVVYILFEKVIINYRPIIMPDAEHPEASFPSSHTMMVIVIMGSTITVLGKYFQSKQVQNVLTVVCCVVIGIMVAGRLMSGVHWFTDVLGGILFGAALLSYYAAARSLLLEDQ